MRSALIQGKRWAVHDIENGFKIAGAVYLPLLILTKEKAVLLSPWKAYYYYLFTAISTTTWLCRASISLSSIWEPSSLQFHQLLLLVSFPSWNVSYYTRNRLFVLEEAFLPSSSSSFSFPSLLPPRLSLSLVRRMTRALHQIDNLLRPLLFPVCFRF